MSSALVALALSVLPGQWIALAPPLRGLALAPRLALGVALTPALTALAALALRGLGLSFAASGAVLAAGAAAAALPLALALARVRPRAAPADVALGAGVGLLLLGCAAAPWAIWDSLRELSWHGLMHADFCYAWVRDGAFPEDPHAAGQPLHYHWLPHVHLAWLAAAGGFSPTRAYAVSNTASLLACAALALALVRALGCSRPAALLGVVLLFLATNAPGAVARAALGAREAAQLGVFGDFRYTPFLAKFVNSNAMPQALALLLAAAWLVTAASRRRIAAAPELYGLLLLATGLFYPPLLPVTALLLPGLLLAVDRDQRARAALLAAFATGVGAVWLAGLTGGHASPLLRLAGAASFAERLLHLAVAFAPLLPLLVPGAARALREREAAGLALLLLAAGSAGGYALARLPDGIEYKFVFGVALGLAPVAAVGFDRFSRRRPTAAWAGASATALLLASLWGLSLSRHLPPGLETAPRVASSAFYLALGPREPDRAWTSAVRRDTPLDTVLVEPPTALKTTAFTGRAAYLARAPRGARVAGFNLSYRKYYDQHGVDAGVRADRRARLDGLYAARAPAAIDARLGELRGLGRPLAIRLTPSEHAALDERLGSLEAARPIYRDPDRAVWLLAATPAL